MGQLRPVAAPDAGTGQGATFSYDVQFADGTRRAVGGEPFAFTLHLRDEPGLERLHAADFESAARAYLSGSFDISGDLTAALRLWRIERIAHVRAWPRALGAVLRPPATGPGVPDFSGEDVLFPGFDPLAALCSSYFRAPADSLDRARTAALDAVCRRLSLQRSERFLDLHCGCGELVVRAAEAYGVAAVGCTTARHFDSAVAHAASRGLGERVLVRRADYAGIGGRFEKIAAIGVLDRLGRRSLRSYFDHAYRLLEDGGLFLNRGLFIPQFVARRPDTLLARSGLKPLRLSDTVAAAELSGFEVLAVRSWRTQAATAARALVEALQNGREASLELVAASAFRSWLLFLAACAANLERGLLESHELVLARRAPLQAR